MPSPHNASAFSSFTTICSGVCFENVLMVIHSARPQAAGTTQNNPLTTNGPKNPDPSRCNTHLSGVTPLSDKPNHSKGLSHTRGTTPVTWRRTRYVAVHPLRGGAPVTSRCTRYVAAHPLCGGAPEQKGCNAYGSGVAPSSTRKVAVVCWMTMLGSLLNGAART